MTLQEAIRIIAEYDEWKLVKENSTYAEHYEHKGSGFRYFTSLCDYYSKSADAMLPIYRRVLVELDPSERHRRMHHIGQYFLYGNVSQACIELATIIQQLNEKK
jgi:hypothetical protein